MADNKQGNSDDPNLFRNAMKGVRLLDAKQLAARKKPPPPVPLQSRHDSDEVLAEMASGRFDFEELEHGDEAYFQRPGLSRSVVRRLRRGQFAVQAELDLHGMAIAEAKSALAAFVHRCSARGVVCVRVIHGKGRRSPGKMPVLKPRVAVWLSRWDDVVAFASARPVDGGTGALYVLLKNR